MRSTFLVLLLSLGAGGALLLNARRSEPTVSSSIAPVKREVSEHNWAKNALDRTDEVKRQVAEQRKQYRDE